MSQRPDQTYFKAWKWKCDICIKSGKLGESIFVSESALKSHGVLKHDEEKKPKKPIMVPTRRKSLRRNYEKKLLIFSRWNALGDQSGDTPKATLDLQEKQETESEDKAKRARRDSNAFMLWRQDYDKEGISKGPVEKEDKAKSIKTPLEEVSTMMKEDWNQLTQELKEPYVDEATKIANGVLTKNQTRLKKAKLDSLAFKQWKQDYKYELIAKGLVAYDAKSKNFKTHWNGLTDEEKEPYLEMAAKQPELAYSY